MECWTSPRPLLNDCEAAIYFNFLPFQNTLTSGQSGPLIYGEVSKRCGCPVIRTPEQVGGLAALLKGASAALRRWTGTSPDTCPVPSCCQDRATAAPQEAHYKKNQWSRWCKTLNILCFYCFHLSTNQKELWAIPIYLFLYSQRHIFFLESGL